MKREVEITRLDCRHEGRRLKSPVAEKMLLNSILEQGIRDPLQVVESDEHLILLDGFKRYRCARKLNLKLVPCQSLGDDEAMAMIELLRVSNAKSLSILEQAALIDELKTTHGMCTAEIAEQLEKSKAWVSVRTGIIQEMSAYVFKQIFKGAFPAYAYMYTLRPFMRINAIGKEEIDAFVKAVAGKKLSVRDIDCLANAYFKGSEEVRTQIEKGQVQWILDRSRGPNPEHEGCSRREKAILNCLEISLKYLQKLIKNPWDKRLQSPVFMAQANLLSGGILRQQVAFSTAIRNIHDRTRQTKSDCGAS